MDLLILQSFPIFYQNEFNNDSEIGFVAKNQLNHNPNLKAQIKKLDSFIFSKLIISLEKIEKYVIEMDEVMEDILHKIEEGEKK